MSGYLIVDIHSEDGEMLDSWRTDGPFVAPSVGERVSVFRCTLGPNDQEPKVQAYVVKRREFSLEEQHGISGFARFQAVKLYCEEVGDEHK